MNIGLICSNRDWAAGDFPYRAVHAGLSRLGHRVAPANSDADGPLWPELPEAVFLWNGVHDRSGSVRGRLVAAGVTVFVMERGWFGRFGYTQIDHAGFNHDASWVGQLSRPAPANGRRRLVASAGVEPVPPAGRAGYALVLLQVPNDAQLRDAEIRHPGALVEAIARSTPAGIGVRLRPHPLSAWRPPATGRARLIEGTLADALAGAKFCVTINSNAGNDALLAGRPVLCLGPALYAIAGVAAQTSLAHLPAALAEMAEGWRPDAGAVDNYLAHLACRQWSLEELADAWPLRKVLDHAAAG